MIKELRSIGLARNDARVYEALVENGPCRAGKLISKLSLHRNLVYECLEKLIRKGFAFKTEVKGVWQFQITDPNHLMTALKSREKTVKNLVEQIQTHHYKSNQEFIVYEGIESYRKYWLDSIERFPVGTVDHCLGAPTNRQWGKMIGERTYKQYLKRREERKIFWKTLHFRITESELWMLRKYPQITEYRLWPRDVECKGNFNVIHDTVILHSVVEPLRIIEIKDPIMVEVFQNYFDMMWEKGRPVVLEKKRNKGIKMTIKKT